MRRLSDLLFRLRAFFRRQAMERDLDDELAFHLDMATARNLEAGMEPVEARRAAERAFGSAVRHRQSVRDAWGTALLDELRSDVRFAVRQVARRPGSTLLAVAVLGLGLGGAVALWSVVHGVLLRPLPFPDEERFVVFWSDGDWMQVELDHVREVARGFDSVSAFTWGSSTWRLGDRTRLVEESLVSGDLFGAIGARPLLGRGLEPADGLPGAERVVVLGHSFWHRELGADPAILGSRLVLDGEPATVVGVMPPGFFFPFPSLQIWRPIVIDPAADAYTVNGYLALLGKVSDDLHASGLAGAIEAIAASLGERFDYPPAWDKSQGATARPLREFLVGRARPALLLLLAAVIVLWSLASADVAALVVARTADRSEELAVRTALGASRGRLAGQLFTEAGLLVCAGTVVGLGCASALFGRLVARLPLGWGFAETLAIGRSSLLFAALLGLVTAGVVTGLSWWGLSGSRVSGGALRARGAVRRRIQKGLVFAEALLAVVLVLGAALLVRSVERLRMIDSGLDPVGALVFDVVLDDTAVDVAASSSLVDEMTDRVRRLPGVTAVGAINLLPLRDNGMQGPIRVESRPELGERALNAFWRSVRADYFDAAGIELRSGRLFGIEDRTGSTPVAIVSESFATKIWGGGDPIGQRFMSANEGFGKWLTVVGVVEEVRMRSLIGDNTMVLYRPQPQVAWSESRGTFVVRTTGDPREQMPAIRAALGGLASRVALTRMSTLEEVVGGTMAEPLRLRFFLTLVGALGLALGCAGVYGVVADQVGRRVGELGVRMALGARSGLLWRETVRREMQPLVAGTAAGLVVAALLARSLSRFLVEVSPSDPASYAGAAAALLLAGLLGVAHPAWRATRVDPVRALRSE